MSRHVQFQRRFTSFGDGNKLLKGVFQVGSCPVPLRHSDAGQVEQIVVKAQHQRRNLQGQRPELIIGLCLLKNAGHKIA
ncbi:MAG: hypothetical protein F9K41_03885 [Sphingopyxis terrae]|nr:MAG: hypothetical protein F9K41_03885 [Sphingopyxis terrae]